MRPLSASATEIRKKLETGKDVSVWIPQEVDHYIRRMKIYAEAS
jgi:nicotinic acid mononucleotide adenylyltransferase